MQDISELNKAKGLLKEAAGDIETFYGRETSLSKEIRRFLTEGSQPNIYRVFEREFGRLLSPFEIEQMTKWIEEGYDLGLIKMALAEAVFLNKLNMRYIDKILWNWQRNNIRTVEEAKEFTRKFRRETAYKLTSSPQRDNKGKQPFEPYNWLEEEE